MDGVRNGSSSFKLTVELIQFIVQSLIEWGVKLHVKVHC